VAYALIMRGPAVSRRWLTTCWVLALFGLALSLPLVLAVISGRARSWLDRLAGLSSRIPVVTGLLFIGLGFWALYFALVVNLEDWV